MVRDPSGVFFGRGIEKFKGIDSLKISRGVEGDGSSNQCIQRPDLTIFKQGYIGCAVAL